MNPIRNPIRLLAAAALMMLPVAVQAQYKITTNNNAITITKYTGSGGAVAISTTLGGLTVTGIGDWAFYECYSLTSVTIPNSVTSIGDGAFGHCVGLTSITIPNSVTNIANYAIYWCNSLTSVTIPASVRSIGQGAFSLCDGLTSIMIPASVTSIGDGAFQNCPSLTAITVDPANLAYSSLSGVLFDKSQAALIQCPVGKVGSYAIPASVTSIGDGAFYDCASLTSVTIPNSVTSIGYSVFSRCTDLTAVYFQGNAPSLGGSSVFGGDNNATVYYLPVTTGWTNPWGDRPTVPYSILQIGASDLGNGWKWLEWFGYFNTTYDSWVWHLQHGWLYPYGTDTSSIFFWDNSRQAWWWTSATTYPYLYRFSDSTWFWYQKGSANPRWFYNLKAAKWENW